MNKQLINDKGYKLQWMKGTEWNNQHYSWYLDCRECGNPTKIGGKDTQSVKCSSCVSRGLRELEENARDS